MDIFKPIFSEDNWFGTSLDDSELKGLTLTPDDDTEDRNNPLIRRIALNRDIHFQWVEYCKTRNDRSEIDQDLDMAFGINLALILSDYSDLPSVAIYPSLNNKLVYTAQSYAIEIYDRKGLLFDFEIAAAIAKPEKWRLTDKQIADSKVIIAGRHGYDLRINLTLTSPDFEELKEAAAFFFAMKARQVDLIRIDGFLDYQLEASFSGDERRFGRFLNLLCKKYGSLDETIDGRVLLKKKWVDMILGWVDLQKGEPKKEGQKAGIGGNNGNDLAGQLTDDVSIRVMNPPERMEWLGTQKNLAELFIELERKGWIKQIRNLAIKAAFTGTNSIEQVLKPDEDRKTHEKNYPQVFTTRYKPAFKAIEGCDQTES